jgi:beta-lactamase regulating signal transducer with metallopeptidase domain
LLEGNNGFQQEPKMYEGDGTASSKDPKVSNISDQAESLSEQNQAPPNRTKRSVCKRNIANKISFLFLLLVAIRIFITSVISQQIKTKLTHSNDDKQ